MTKKKPASLSCKPACHSFAHVNVTPSVPITSGGLSQWQMQTSPTPVFKLYCSKCGQVRSL